ncbi:MAG: glycosyltransferase family 4 protein [Bacteroidales bacterium]|nr:glycosyltransferase family 4 protein [Bacteroidales bacterium]
MSLPDFDNPSSTSQASKAFTTSKASKALIITYYWPPSSGAGVQRWLKFSKYLPSFGWEPIILTINPEYATYPAIDNSLCSEISGDLKVYRTNATDYFRFYNKDKSKIPSAGFATDDQKGFRTNILRFVRGNFFIPDPRRGWNKHALREACRLIEEEGIKHIITTSPPHSTQLIGLKLKKKYPEIKWIADLRDPWTDIYYYDQFFHTPYARKIDGNYEKKVLKTADRIITVGQSLKNLFCAKLPGIENKTEVITNGYDENDFIGLSPSNPEILTISYIGTLSDSYPVSGFIEAFKSLVSNGYKIQLRFVGTVSPGQKNLILSEIDNSLVQFLPFVNHQDAIKYMMGSSALLLIIPDHQSNRSIITGKLFEYLASGKPVLCIGPEDGDAAGILSSTSHGICAGYDDNEGIRRIIKNCYEASSQEGKSAPAEFNRVNLTKKLASLL